MIKVTLLTLAFSLLLLFSSCSNNRTIKDPVKLCLRFYDLNKNANINPLLNVGLLSLREHSIYDNQVGKLQRISSYLSLKDTLNGYYANFRVYSHLAFINKNEKKKYFDLCDSLCLVYLKNHSPENKPLFDSYCQLVDSIFYYYKKIQVPNELPYANIEIDGEGSYVVFILYKHESPYSQYGCYYFKNSCQHKEIKENLNKIDENWYYYIR